MKRTAWFVALLPIVVAAALSGAIYFSGKHPLSPAPRFNGACANCDEPCHIKGLEDMSYFERTRTDHKCHKCGVVFCLEWYRITWDGPEKVRPGQDGKYALAGAFGPPVRFCAIVGHKKGYPAERREGRCERASR